MLSSTQLASLVAFLLPTAQACLGYTGGIPTPTKSISNSAVINVAAGATFDGGWAKYDRGSGACNDQAEGGTKVKIELLASQDSNGLVTDQTYRRCGCCFLARRRCNPEKRDHRQEPS
jgi:hypothetical protein